MFRPQFHITSSTARALMAIEADRQIVDQLPIDLAMLASLRETARLTATHYSTQIEGNRLTQAQVNEVVKGAAFPGRERDEIEVRNYYQAAEWTERIASHSKPITETNIRSIHALVMTGRPQSSPYRDGQNVIRDSRSRAIVYMPPEPKDVPRLMAELVRWITQNLKKSELPIPLVAGLAHYQFATIHPYYDGNGRTARLLTTLILHKAGYGLKGIYSLEEYYARDLSAYYAALTIGPSHNYYLGREGADITPFLDYFCHGMAQAFAAVRTQATRAAQRGATDVAPQLRKLAPRERRLLELFKLQDTATAAQIARHLRLSHRTIISLCRRWLADGLLQLHDPSRKNRSYSLAEPYDQLLH